jgi:hypothetical protein
MGGNVRQIRTWAAHGLEQHWQAGVSFLLLDLAVTTSIVVMNAEAAVVGAAAVELNNIFMRFLKIASCTLWLGLSS